MFPVKTRTRDLAVAALAFQIEIEVLSMFSEPRYINVVSFSSTEAIHLCGWPLGKKLCQVSLSKESCTRQLLDCFKLKVSLTPFAILLRF